MRKIVITVATIATLFVSGCSMKSATEASAPSAKSGSGLAINVNKMSGQDTPFDLNMDANKLTLSFPKLDNFTEKDFQKTSCKSTFEYEKSFVDPASDESVYIYSGSWSSANNNCALYVERVSSTFSDESSPRYVLVGQSGFIMSYDMLGRDPIIKGSFSK
jgi:hypothetical protein